MNVDAGEGQFKLSFRGQTTADLAYNATPAAVQAALRALPKIGSSGVNVTGTPQAYVVTFAGALAGTNVEPLKSSNGTTPLGGGGGGGVSVSTTTEGGNNHPVSIEAHLENLTIGATYHFRIFATNAAGTESTSDRIFIPTLSPKGPPCPNEQLREENLSTRPARMPRLRDGHLSQQGRQRRGTIRYFNGGDAVSICSHAQISPVQVEAGIGEQYLRRHPDRHRLGNHPQSQWAHRVAEIRPRICETETLTAAGRLWPGPRISSPRSGPLLRKGEFHGPSYLRRAPTAASN